MSALAITRLAATASSFARHSRGWSAASHGEAALVIGAPDDEAIVLGSFQRRSEVGPTSELVLRRGSGGGAARVGPGSIWLQLALARPDALVPCTADKVLNRYVRPLLRALTRVSSVPVSYFGRDWISAAHRPVGLVGFAHDTATGRVLFEALVAITTPFSVNERPTFLGKPEATLEETARRELGIERVVLAIVDAYATLASEVSDAPAVGSAGAEAEDRREESTGEWLAKTDEPMGTIAAGRDAAGKIRVGGELMVSQDAHTRLEERLNELPAAAASDEIGRIVDETFAGPGAVVFGVRSLASVRDVIVAARAEPFPPSRRA